MSKLCPACGARGEDFHNYCWRCGFSFRAERSEVLQGCPPSASGYAACPVEQIFREVALMTPAPPKDEDPYQSEEYQKFVESMAQYCHCEPIGNRPCDGVLAGGLCDGMDWRRDYDYEDA